MICVISVDTPPQRRERTRSWLALVSRSCRSLSPSRSPGSSWAGRPLPRRQPEMTARRGSSGMTRSRSARPRPGGSSMASACRAQGRVHFTWDPMLHRQPDRDWRRWGTDDLMRTSCGSSRSLRRHPSAPRIGVGDLSLPQGGYFGPEIGGGIGHGSIRTASTSTSTTRDRPDGSGAAGRQIGMRSPRTWWTCSSPPGRCDLRRPEHAAHRATGGRHPARQP